MKKVEQLEAQFKKIKAELEKERKKVRYTGKVTLEFFDSKGKKLRSFKGLDAKEAFRLQRDLYKLLVTSMKQNISMKKVKETA